MSSWPSFPTALCLFKCLLNVSYPSFFLVHPHGHSPWVCQWLSLGGGNGFLISLSPASPSKWILCTAAKLVFLKTDQIMSLTFSGIFSSSSLTHSRFLTPYLASEDPSYLMPSFILSNSFRSSRLFNVAAASTGANGFSPFHFPCHDLRQLHWSCVVMMIL